MSQHWSVLESTHARLFEDKAVDLTLCRYKVQVTGTYSALGGMYSLLQRLFLRLENSCWPEDLRGCPDSAVNLLVWGHLSAGHDWRLSQRDKVRALYY